MRPDYCPCYAETPDPCPECGATVSGKDKVRGICQARFGYRRPPDVNSSFDRQGDGRNHSIKACVGLSAVQNKQRPQALFTRSGPHNQRLAWIQRADGYISTASNAFYQALHQG